MTVPKSILILICIFAVGLNRNNHGVDAFMVTEQNPTGSLVRRSVQNNNKGMNQIIILRSYRGEDLEQEQDMPRTMEFREEEPLFDHDDWVRHRTRRADDSENIATALFGGFVLFLWFVAVQV